MRDKGVRFQPICGRQAFKIDGKFKFWGGLYGGGLGRRSGPGREPRARPAARRHPGALPEPARRTDCRRRRCAPACACAARGETVAISTPARWCSPAAASRPMPRCAPATSARAGIWPRCAAAASTPATASAWRSTSAPPPTATGPAVTPSAGTATRRSSATSPSATTSRSTATPFGIMLNANGERFVDEGADFRNYTYAKYGARDPEAARAVRLADLRSEGDPPAARRVPHPPGHQGHRATRWRSWWRSSTASTPRPRSKTMPPTTQRSRPR